jgi:hypothetical protein
MTFFKLRYLQVLLLLGFYSSFCASPKVGFFLPDSVQELRLKFTTVKNLIILPVVINDNVKVNLILDTGCRNLVLFGKKFYKLLKMNSPKQITFSGLGDGKAVNGNLSLDNHVSINSIHGYGMPIVVVPDKNIFNTYSDIHGIIGYDIFLKFEIEINAGEQLITFRPALRATPRNGYAQVPLEIVDSRPIMKSSVVFDSNHTTACDLMIDTGSSLGILLKTTDTGFILSQREVLLGRGLNGPLYGFQMRAEKLRLKGFDFFDVNADIVKSQWHNYASIGMDILKDYVLVLNYCKAYACLKKVA